MNWFKVFYWISIADNLRGVLCVFAWVTLIFAMVAFGFFVFGDRDLDDMTAKPNGLSERSKKWFWWSLPMCILFFALNAAIPSRKDALLIIAGGGAMEYFTTDSTAKQLPHELTNFVVGELRVLAADAKVQLLSYNTEAEIMRQAKELTTEELLEKMRSDSIFAKIILDR